jgi:SAM-dependent methyltransferase
VFETLKRWIQFNFRYFGKPLWDSGISPPELIDFINNHQPGRALEMGAGSGTNMLTLFRAGWEVVGVEYALRAVMIGRRKLRDNGFSPSIYFKSVVTPLSVEGEFDLILDIGCFHSLSLEEKAEYNENVLRYLRTGGIFLIYGFLQSSKRRSGISKIDIDIFKEIFVLIQRNEGVDPNSRSSIWMQFGREN